MHDVEGSRVQASTVAVRRKHGRFDVREFDPARMWGSIVHRASDDGAEVPEEPATPCRPFAHHSRVRVEIMPFLRLVRALIVALAEILIGSFVPLFEPLHKARVAIGEVFRVLFGIREKLPAIFAFGLNAQ